MRRTRSPSTSQNNAAKACTHQHATVLVCPGGGVENYTIHIYGVEQQIPLHSAFFIKIHCKHFTTFPPRNKTKVFPEVSSLSPLLCSQTKGDTNRKTKLILPFMALVHTICIKLNEFCSFGFNLNCTVARNLIPACCELQFFHRLFLRLKLFPSQLASIVSRFS